ncbi:hypothetical protein GWK47_018256 [Chionoecetes opilio]|uniref:Uncharacterized protein n=1 Tax=Chionoecetes opilio TaxID=41210 RepID=A0A8J5CIQ7_CHIOP|nr:hypothetical protein GWK47_018256 [Chionoecetes opilio]
MSSATASETVGRKRAVRSPLVTPRPGLQSRGIAKRSTSGVPHRRQRAAKRSGRSSPLHGRARKRDRASATIPTPGQEPVSTDEGGGKRAARRRSDSKGTNRRADLDPPGGRDSGPRTCVHLEAREPSLYREIGFRSEEEKRDQQLLDVDVEYALHPGPPAETLRPSEEL